MTPRRRERTPHADDWLITYADAITLLLCLFVVALTLRSGQKAPEHEVVAPEGPAAIVAAMFPRSPPLAAPVAAPLAAPDNETRPEPVFDDGVWDPEPPLIVLEKPVEAPSIPVLAEEAGDRIRTLQLNSALFFARGGADLSPEGKAILRDIAATLTSPAFAAFHVTIEGHTDDTPISTPRFESNWELSTARAAAVVRFFLVLGLPAERLTAAGYADTFPVAPNRTAEGVAITENQAANRRVVVRLEKIDKAR
jgi:chemotaxis protein MotB